MIAKSIPRCTRREWIHFIQKVDIQECWEWQGSKSGGYGRTTFRGRNLPSHRFSYTQLRSAVPSDLTLDHLCRNRACVNPEHLEIVTIEENCFRGESISAVNKKKSQCSKGHEYTVENTITVHRSSGHVERLCRTCHKKSNNNWSRNKK